SKTAANGEINCIDSGGFGAVTITKSIAINCENVVGGVLASGTNGIIVNGAYVVVVLRGLDIDGAVTGLNGIRFLNGSALHVQKCLVRGFRAASPNGNGIQFAPTAANAELYISDSFVSANNFGVVVQPSGAGSAKVILSNVRIENNTNAGFRAESTVATSTINATIVDGVVGGNGNGVVNLAPAGTGASQLVLQRLAILSNTSNGLRGDGARATTRAAETVITGNATGTAFNNGAQFLSYGNNRIDGNVSNGPNPQIIGQK
ncbi:MAG: right-handed parallel beta-helix repeat-containing protein, partial [Methyloceanibacter sp.]